jgi:hypothetical protein
LLGNPNLTQQVRSRPLPMSPHETLLVAVVEIVNDTQSSLPKIHPYSK